MIALSAPTFDLTGHVLLRQLDPSSDIAGVSRRVSRTATLDGGATLEDKGYAAADKTLLIQSERITLTVYETITRLARVYALVRVATREGVYEGAIEEVSHSNGSSTIRVLVKQQLSA